MEERLAQGEMMNLRVKLGSEVTTDPTYVQRVKISGGFFYLGFLIRYERASALRVPGSPMSYPFAVHVPYSDIFSV